MDGFTTNWTTTSGYGVLPCVCTIGVYYYIRYVLGSQGQEFVDYQTNDGGGLIYEGVQGSFGLAIGLGYCKQVVCYSPMPFGWVAIFLLG